MGGKAIRIWKATNIERRKEKNGGKEKGGVEKEGEGTTLGAGTAPPPLPGHPSSPSPCPHSLKLIY